MGRPRPNVLLEVIDRQSYKMEQIISSDGVWSVFYQNKPINLKSSNQLTSYPGPKYKKVSFSNPGHAISLCKKLNAKFKTEDFTVVLLDAGTKVFPENAN